MRENKQIKKWVLTDSHFLHKKIVEIFGYRPPDFTEKIIKNCQEVIKEQDILIHLGDVIWGNKQQLTEILSQIPGTKILVRGNHDRCHSDTWFINSGFSFVCDKITIGKYVLSHHPSKIEEDQINIHGHFHTIKKERWEPYLIDRLTENHYLLAMEITKYNPVFLDTAIAKKYVKKTLEMS